MLLQRALSITGNYCQEFIFILGKVLLHNTVCSISILKCLFPQSTTAEHQRLSRAWGKTPNVYGEFLQQLPEENRGKENRFMFVDMFGLWVLGCSIKRWTGLWVLGCSKNDEQVSGLKCAVHSRIHHTVVLLFDQVQCCAAHSAVGFTALVRSPTALSVPGPVLSAPLSFMGSDGLHAFRYKELAAESNDRAVVEM